MATLTLRPNANSYADNGVQYPATGNVYDKVNDVTPDGDSTYIRPYYDGVGIFAFGYPDHTSESGTINSVKVYARCRNYYYTANALRMVIRSGTTNYYSSYIQLSTSYDTKSVTYNTNPASGSAWTWDDIDSLQAGVELGQWSAGKDGDAAICTQIYVEVDYTPTKSFKYWFIG